MRLSAVLPLLSLTIIVSLSLLLINSDTLSVDRFISSGLQASLKIVHDPTHQKNFVNIIIHPLEVQIAMYHKLETFVFSCSPYPIIRIEQEYC